MENPQFMYKALDKAIACIAENLPEEDLLTLHRTVRLFRVYLTALFFSMIELYDSLFPGGFFFPRVVPTQILSLEASALASWNYFRWLVVGTLFLPFVGLCLIGWPFLLINSALRQKVQAKTFPFWLEFIVAILGGAVAVSFWGDFTVVTP